MNNVSTGHSLSTRPVAGSMHIRTRLSDLLGLPLPIVCAPMMMVSSPELAIAACRAGLLGTLPALNYSAPQDLALAVKQIREAVDGPFAIQIRTDSDNVLAQVQIEVCTDERVPVIIATPGDPRRVIEKAHEVGLLVLVEVVSVATGQQAQDLGADGVILRTCGAAGRTGHLSPLASLPELRDRLSIPIVLAGGVADGRGMAAAFAAGADGVQIGTRFIASVECTVIDEYKDAITQTSCDDLFVTSSLTGFPLSLIETAYAQRFKAKTEMVLDLLGQSRLFRRVTALLNLARTMVLLGNSAHKNTVKQVWTAGQAAGMINEVLPIDVIVDQIITSYNQALKTLPPLERSQSIILH